MLLLPTMRRQVRSNAEHGAIIERIKVQTAPGFGAAKEFRLPSDHHHA